MNAIVRQIEKLPTIFDFDKRGLGPAMAALVAASIMEAMEQETSPAGGGWPELSAAYAGWKARAAPGEPMAVLYGHMRTREQLEGLCRVTAREVVQTYGTDELARDLAVWFQEGSTKQNRPPRPFYLFGEIARARLAEHLDAHFAAAVRNP